MRVFHAYLVRACLALVLAVGCKSASSSERAQSIVSTVSLEVEDMDAAVTQLSDSLLKSPGLAMVRGRKAIIAVERFANKTQQAISGDQFAFTLLRRLDDSQRVQSTAIFGPGTHSDLAAFNPITAQLDAKVASVVPDSVLRGQIVSPGDAYEIPADDRLSRRATYVIQLLLADPATGLAVWRDEYVVVKQIKRAHY